MYHSIKWLLVTFFAILLTSHTALAAQKFTSSKVYGDWVLNCSKKDDTKDDAKETCSLQQKMLTEKGAMILSISILKTGNAEERVAVFLLPLGFYIPGGVYITVDSGKPRRLLVNYCTQSGCAAQSPLEKNLFIEMALGNKMKVSMVSGNRSKKLDFALSLRGITAGLKALR